VQINQEKMSKSLGNFFTIREIFEKSKWPEAETGEMLRYFLLGTHYRSPLDFSDKSIEEAKNALNGFYELLVTRLVEPEERSEADKGLMEVIERCRVAFRAAMDDDFNTSVAIAALQGMRSGVNKLLDLGLSTEARTIARKELRSLGNCFGLFQLDEWRFRTVQLSGVARAPSGRLLGAELKISTSLLTDSEIEGKVFERNEARKQKDFKRADEIRQSLASQGIVIEDKPNGTSRWKR
jgi:cysteinyl-tRNA synthetase